MMNMQTRTRCGAYRTVVATILAIGVLGGSACSMDNIVGKNDLPSTIADPGKTKTVDGALRAYYGTLALFRDAIASNDVSGAYILQTAQLTDEAYYPSNGNASGYPNSRVLPEGKGAYEYGYPAVYTALQQTRGQAGQAVGLLRDYYPAATQGPLMAHMYAVEGYVELLLAEAFCSGIPLSTLDYNGDYTLQSGSKTVDVLTHAIVRFDSALALAGDSVRILNLARVGKARALQQLGKIADAAQMVSAVPDNFQYNFLFSVDAGVCGVWNCPTYTGALQRLIYVYAPIDREGRNGLPFMSEHDGRIPNVLTSGIDAGALDIPRNYAIRLASGVEAQLIQAEAELSANNPNWLVRLNALRTTCTDAATCPSPAPAGLGGVAGLPPLSAPPTSDAQLDLIFRERAYWMFLTGHRQGDLRRLIREYHRDQATVYPVGIYFAPFAYGSDVNFPIPYTERKLNPLYHGCINRDA